MRFSQFILFCSCIVLTVSSCSDGKPTRDGDHGEFKSIPTINIQTTGGNIPWDKKESCTAFYMYKGDTIEISARIKCRGGMSSRYDKHSYSIEFDKYLKIGDSPADDDWILNASYIDKTFQRHKLRDPTMRGLRRHALDTRPRLSYVVAGRHQHWRCLGDTAG